jgi:hypothetical protein
MEIDGRELREFILFIFDQLYKARAELIAYEVAHTFLTAAGLSQEFDQLLEQARKNPSPLLLADHQAARDTVEQLLREEKTDAAMNFLRNWKPQGGPIQ